MKHTHTHTQHMLTVKIQTHSSSSRVTRYAGALFDVDMRVEVAMVDSNILISANDGPVTYSRGTGELFGARVIVAGNGSAVVSGR
jgi:hypothetical protein